MDSRQEGVEERIRSILVATSACCTNGEAWMFWERGRVGLNLEAISSLNGDDGLVGHRVHLREMNPETLLHGGE